MTEVLPAHMSNDPYTISEVLYLGKTTCAEIQIIPGLSSRELRMRVNKNVDSVFDFSSETCLLVGRTTCEIILRLFYLK
jgi:hypothetical protein